jgi:RNA polymerase sigma factor for flagellar operon FliA
MQERASIAPVDQQLADGGSRYYSARGRADAALRRYLPLVRQVARQLLGRVIASADLEDLVSCGTLGLIDALGRYEPAREALFSTYARIRIRGAILDHLREIDWVPRSVREKAAAVERTARALESILGRPAREDELAHGLGLSLAAYRGLRIQIAPVSLISLEDLGVASGEPELPLEHAHADPLQGLLDRERLSVVTRAISQLPEREQLLLTLYYRDELTMKEVGTSLGLTESRVSQLHTQTLGRLRTQLDTAARPPLQSGAMPRDGNQCARPGTGSGRRLKRFTM